jgi:hypothetical protein
VSGISMDFGADRFALISLAFSELITIDMITKFKLFIVIKKSKIVSVLN